MRARSTLVLAFAAPLAAALLAAACATGSGSGPRGVQEPACAGATAVPEGVEHPRSLSGRQPPAPRSGADQGWACIEVTIDETGAVTDPEVLGTNNSDFAASFVRVVPTWRFAPATRDGQPVAVRYTLTAHYRRSGG